MPNLESQKERNIPLAEFFVFPYLLEVHELAGYDHCKPLWGKRTALYHPVTSQYVPLSNDEWQVYDALKTRLPYQQHSIVQEGDSNETHAILQTFAERFVILPPSKNTTLTYVIPHNDAQLYLEVTQHCNFRCPGCAVGSEQYTHGTARSLSKDELIGIVEHTIRSASEVGKKSLNIKYAGGEPLLPAQFELITQVQSAINEIQQQFPDVRLRQTVLTNGSFLSEEAVRFLKKYDIHAAVSLWGIGEENDQSRVVRRTQDRFPFIVEGIRRIYESGASFNINYVISPKNVTQYADAISQFWDITSDTFIGTSWYGERRPLPLTFSLFRPSRQQLPATSHIRNNELLIDGLRQGFDVVRKLIADGIPLQPLDNFDYLHLSTILPSTCGVGKNLIAAGPGGFTSCHQHLFGLQDSTPSMGTNLFDFVNEPYKNILPLLNGQNIDFEDIDPKLAYTLSLHGGAGCPDSAHAVHGIYGRVSPNTALYASLLPELLSLEMMRKKSS